MATPEEQAVAFKNDGNKAYAAHDWNKAIELYTKAIELNDQDPVFWSNRAQVRLLYPAYLPCGSRCWLVPTSALMG
jgi:serine/threonine-protein phosphatase 5